MVARGRHVPRRVGALRAKLGNYLKTSRHVRPANVLLKGTVTPKLSFSKVVGGVRIGAKALENLSRE